MIGMLMRLPVLLVVLLVCSNALAAQVVCFKCHDERQFHQKVVHKPVAQGRCGTCHNPHVAKFKGLVQKRPSELCSSCHQGRWEKGKDKKAMRVIHQPVRQGKCLTCHDPHTSRSRGLIKGNLADRCFDCHKDLPKRYEHTHKPFAQGRCSACHLSHAADNYRLLKGPPEKLCAGCHAQRRLSTAHKGYPARLGACLTCHNPHGSKKKALVRDHVHEPYGKKACDKCHGGKATRDTEGCLSCHEDIRKATLSLHSHVTTTGGNSCTLCHSPHAGDTPELLKGRQVQVCRRCHEDTFRRHQDKLYIHPKAPYCKECHGVHGSNRLAMLRADGNTVCERCHKTQGKFTHPVGDKVKDPRTGQSMNCISCHLPMGTDYKYELILSGEKDLCIQCHRNY